MSHNELPEEPKFPCRVVIWLGAACLGWCGLYVLIAAMLKASGVVRLALNAMGL